ncbi:MAG: GGDEF domain-containing protein [Proteobacteria bacterium]|nr:GGDEF domain-containing protein [Pseudomonadota bacterium]MBU1417494.1 GGDEF domain-containing protein [Pseudomonadota bacterium]
MTERDNNRSKKATAKKLLSIESKNRLSSDSIESLSEKPNLLKEYLNLSIANTFSELMFRLTHEIYSEDKAKILWDKIITHKEEVESKLGRDVGILVTALDYLTNISGDLISPKIIEDRRIEEAALMATRDHLTGLYLRSVFDFSIERLYKGHKRYGKNLSLLMIDVDNFKKVNDNFGHQCGDTVLTELGKIVLETIRDADLAARYGGEEISIILPETSEDKAVIIAERLRINVKKCFYSEPKITISIGVSSNMDLAISGIDIIRYADKALYAAKLKGKNRVEAWPG